MEQKTPTFWQDKMRDDASWLKNRIGEVRSKAVDTRAAEDQHFESKAEFALMGAGSGAVFGAVLGTAMAAIDSLVRKEPVMFDRLATYAGPAALGGALFFAMTSVDPHFHQRPESPEPYEEEAVHLEGIKLLLEEAYGKDTMDLAMDDRWRHYIDDNGEFTSQGITR